MERQELAVFVRRQISYNTFISQEFVPFARQMVSWVRIDTVLYDKYLPPMGVTGLHKIRRLSFSTKNGCLDSSPVRRTAKCLSRAKYLCRIEGLIKQ